MMNLKVNSWLAMAILLGAATLAGRSLAEVNSTGYDSSLEPFSTPSSGATGDCSILYYGTVESSVEETDRLQDLGLNLTICTDPAEFTLEYLVNFDVLVLFVVPPGDLIDQTTAIELEPKQGSKRCCYKGIDPQDHKAKDHRRFRTRKFL